MPSPLRVSALLPLLLVACAAPAARPAPAPAEAAADEQVYEINQVQVPPRLQNANEFTRILARTFPPTLRYGGSRGRVTVSFIVGPSGHPRAIRVLRASHDAFVQPTIDAVNHMRFSPGILRGRAVSVRIEEPIDGEVRGNPSPS